MREFLRTFLALTAFGALLVSMLVPASSSLLTQDPVACPSCEPVEEWQSRCCDTDCCQSDEPEESPAPCDGDDCQCPDCPCHASPPHALTAVIFRDLISRRPKATSIFSPDTGPGSTQVKFAPPLPPPRAA